MRELGIRSKVMRVGNGLGKGYTLADVTAAYERYVSSLEADSEEGGG